MASRRSSLLSRARASRRVRRLAGGALQRLAQGVDRLLVALEEAQRPLLLQESATGSEDQSLRPEPLDVQPKAPTPRPAEAPAAAAPIVAKPGTVIPTPHRPPPAATSVPATPTTTDTTLPKPGSPTTLGLELVSNVRQRVDPQIARLRAGVSWEQAEDPSVPLHGMRVASRRLQSFVVLFGPLMTGKKRKRALKQLLAITPAVGIVREWDALLEALRGQHEEANPLARAALEHVTVWARQQREASLAPTRKALGKIDILGLADLLEDELDRLSGRLLRVGPELPRQSWAWLAPILEELFSDWPVADDESHVEELHEIRTRAKKIRYTMELLRPVLGEAYPPLRQPAKRTQRMLGVHHEAALLTQRLTHHAEGLESQGLGTLADALRKLAARQLKQRAAAYEEARPALEELHATRYRSIASAELTGV